MGLKKEFNAADQSSTSRRGEKVSNCTCCRSLKTQSPQTKSIYSVHGCGKCCRGDRGDRREGKSGYCTCSKSSLTSKSSSSTEVETIKPRKTKSTKFLLKKSPRSVGEGVYTCNKCKHKKTSSTCTSTQCNCKLRYKSESTYTSSCRRMKDVATGTVCRCSKTKSTNTDPTAEDDFPDSIHVSNELVEHKTGPEIGNTYSYTIPMKNAKCTFSITSVEVSVAPNHKGLEKGNVKSIRQICGQQPLETIESNASFENDETASVKTPRKYKTHGEVPKRESLRRATGNRSSRLPTRIVGGRTQSANSSRAKSRTPPSSKSSKESVREPSSDRSVKNGSGSDFSELCECCQCRREWVQ